jgi:hypothetical protein
MKIPYDAINRQLDATFGAGVVTLLPDGRWYKLRFTDDNPILSINTSQANGERRQDDETDR